jgi:hemerythrin superfamily protein
MPRKNAASQDAISLLKSDHAEIAALFAGLETAADSEREDLAERICTLLTVHATCEAELLYPAAHAALDDHDPVFEAEIEHDSARGLIAQVDGLAIDDPRFGATVKVLRETVRHHVSKEERVLFPRLRKTALDLEELGSSIRARQLELQHEGFAVDDPGAGNADAHDDEDADRARRRRVGYAANR